MISSRFEFSSGFDRIGDWNPQLFRELKGRLTLRNVGIVAALAIAGQLLLLALFYSQVPVEGFPNRYCTIISLDTYECARDDLGNVVILWQTWWQDILRTFNWIIIFLSTLPGVYLLALDLDREERQGTLNFIRLSPQSGRSFLMGKLMGVPILADVAIALLIPLHVWAGFQAGAPLTFLLSFYVLLQAGSLFLFSAAMLGGFLSKFQPGFAKIQVGQGMALVLVLVTLMVFLPGYISWNLFTSWMPFTVYLTGHEMEMVQGLEWFYWPLWQNSWLAHGFTLGNLALGSYWIWQGTLRCYESPGYTLLSKTQSYSLLLYLQLFILGFFLQSVSTGLHYSNTLYIGLFMGVYVVDLVLCLGVIVLLSNHRQTLLDWARFRHVQATQNQDTPRPRRFSLWLDLLRGEKSPANLAIALNLLILGLVLCLWIAFWPSDAQRPLAFLGLVLSLNMLAIYAAIVQLLLVMKDQRRVLWAVLAVAVVMGVPLAIAAAYSNPYSQSSEAMMTQYLLFSPIPLAGIINSTFSMGMFLKTLLAQWTVLAILNGRMAQQLRKLGESDSKRLLVGEKG